ncbi:MAG: hypothetical protein J5809_00005, partial [Selenomonadaceae bacterium]|nr:hypothetical protein [Selenomonadaceae bacterium]
MTQLEVILKFMEALDKTAKTDSTEMLDEAIQACSDYTGIEDARQQFLAAAKAAANSTTFLAECGINVSNTDTGGITGADAGGSVTKTADTTVLEIANTYTANSSATAAQNIFTGSNGWHVQATGFDDTIYSGGEDSISAGAGNDFIYLDGFSEVVVTGGDNDTVSVGSGVKNFTVKDYVAGKTTILGAGDFTSVLSVNSDGTSTVKFTRSGTVTSSSLAASNPSVDLSKVTTIKGYFNGSGSFVGNSTLASGNFLGNVTSEFDPSFLDVDASGNLSFTYGGLKLNIIGQRDPTSRNITTAINASNIDSLKGDWRYVIIAGLYKWWFKEALQLNEEATGLNFTDGGSSVTEINLYFENYTSQSWLAYVSHSYSKSSGKALSLSLVVNEKYFGSISNENDPNCVVSGGGTLDRTIAHEFNHAVFAANVNFFAYLPLFLKEGMAELIHGIDDKRLGSIITLMNNSVNNNSNAWLDDYLRTDIINSNQAATLKGGGGSYPYVAGYIFLRWLAKTASDSSNASILSSDKLSARVELRTDGIYYISGKSTDLTTARVISFDSEYTGVSVGSASGKTYTLNSAIKQIVTYFNDQSSWNISGVGSNVTIVADDSATGGDSITGSGSYALIYSGAGNDTISLTGSRNSITGGTGNDVIYSSGSANIFSYTEGDGADVIYNFSANDTLEVAGKSFATVASGSDVVVKIGTGAVTLKGAAGKTLHIDTSEITEPVCKIGSVTYTSLTDAIAAASSGDTITLTQNLSLTGAVTISAGKNITLELNGKTITSTASAALIYGGYLTVKDSSAYHTGSITGAAYALQKTGSGSLTINDEARDIAAAWSISGTTATYRAASKTAGYAISSDGKTFSYSAASGGETLATITGLVNGADASDISMSGSEIILPATVLGTGTASVSGNYTLKLGSGVATPKATSAYWDISGTTANYIGAGTTAGYVLSDDRKSIAYQNPTGDTLISITHLREGSTLAGISLDGTEVTLSESVLGEETVYISAGYALKLGADVVTPVTTPAYWSISGTMAIYTAAYSTAGHYLMGDARSIRYSAASGGNTLATVSGLKSGASIDGISRKNKVVTLNASMLGEDTVTISEGYTLKLANDVVQSSTTAAHWEISGGVANYIAEAVSAGYVLSADASSISYVSASGGETEIAITGLSSRATVRNISVSGTEITLAAAALNKETVTISDGYTLKLADNVTVPVSTAAHWELTNGTANYIGEAFSAGYALENNQIVYKAATTGEVEISVTGVKSLDGISRSGKTVTVASAALNQKTVTISDGYTLKLAGDVTTPVSTAAHWEISNGTA